ncbi:MAG: DUF350 domain-containing protein [Alphaproteobacteria bacterium]|nr:DUF350 domain-containing protein [Alphaproteobacteria bacterium]
MTIVPATALHPVLDSLLYTGLGLALFAVALVVAARVSPFSLRKEIEEDQNVALGIMLGSMFLGIAIIVAAAID